MSELSKYQELIHNLANKREEIDLDDGVVINHAKFRMCWQRLDKVVMG